MINFIALFCFTLPWIVGVALNFAALSCSSSSPHPLSPHQGNFLVKCVVDHTPATISFSSLKISHFVGIMISTRVFEAPPLSFAVCEQVELTMLKMGVRSN